MTYILAEIASAHDGDVGRLRELVDAAVEADADGVKFQVWAPDEVDLPVSLFLGDSVWVDVFAKMSAADLHPWVSIYGQRGWHIANLHGISRRKVHRGPLPRNPGGTIWYDSLFDPTVARVIYGMQMYPTPPSMSQIRALADSHVSHKGYHDHSCDYVTKLALCAMALAKGAELLEIHIDLDAPTKGKDKVSALKPAEFAQFVTEIREIEQAL